MESATYTAVAALIAALVGGVGALLSMMTQDIDPQGDDHDSDSDGDGD